MSGRSTPSQRNSGRLTTNVSHLRNVQVNGVNSRNSDNVLASLRATQIVASKPFLPAELIATILEYLPVPDLIRFARTSRRLREMVYDDTRWIQKLRAIGAWDENEARQRFEDVAKRKGEAQKAKDLDAGRMTSSNQATSSNGNPGGGRRHAGSVTLFDAGKEEDGISKSSDRRQAQTQKRAGSLADGFYDAPSSSPAAVTKPWDPEIALHVMSRVRCIRGKARQEFGEVYGALGPLYNDLVRVSSQSNALIFRAYRDPEQQAETLTNLKRFAQCDTAQGWLSREQKLDTMIAVFENAVLREFEQGYAAGDIDGRMNRYAHVLVTLNGGSAGVDSFISKHPIMARNIRAGNPLDCLEAVASDHVDLNPSQAFFQGLASTMVEQVRIVNRVFPPTVDVMTPFLSRLCEEIISDYLTALFDEAHSRSAETYVKAVSGTFEQSLRFVASLQPSKASPQDFKVKAMHLVTQCYNKHVDLYLTEELAVFRAKCDAEVSQWEKELSDQEASQDSFFMSNVSRQAAKRDFLSSFKKMVMMPVHVLPAFPLSSPFATSKPVQANISTANLAAIDTSYAPSRSITPTLTGTNTPQRSSTPVQAAQDAPTTELAAKAAIMNSRLEGIKSLFSIEVALNLTHYAKASLERAAIMVRMGGKCGDEAREQCEAIFVTMLHILGHRHIKNGFDKAVAHLGNYNPREVREFRVKAMHGDAVISSGDNGALGGVEPLVTFLELVNVGDLIQQMVDVFYSQELVATKLTDRDDFLDPAVKEKKRFEHMLDERVAAGLNKGIDVLIDEVEYICATTQVATDFNPGADKDEKAGGAHHPSGGVVDMDVGPSATAKQVIDMVGGHTGMLLGSTDKNMLDVFTQEVGLRLFGALCKHFKRQRISVDGAVKLISDINHYSAFVASLRQKPLQPYFYALRELGQIYLVHVDPPANYFSANAKGSRMSILSTKATKTQLQAKELAAIIADSQRYHGIFPAEEVYEFAERRADWFVIKSDVERAMYGVGCHVM